MEIVSTSAPNHSLTIVPPLNSFLYSFARDLIKRWVVVKLRAVINISFVIKWRWELEPFSRYRCLTKWSEQERRKMALSVPHTFAFSCLSRGFWALIWVLLISKALVKTRRLNKLLVYLCWSYTTFAEVMHILRVGAILHRESTDSLIRQLLV